MAIRSYSALGMLLPPIIIMAHDYSHALSTINACWVYHVETVSKMGLVLLITFCNIWVCMCWTGPFEFRWLKGYIYNPSSYIIIKLQVSTFPIVVIFFRGCVSEMVVLPYSVIYSICIYLGNTGTLFQLLMFSLSYLQTIGYIMACRSCSFVCKLHHLIIIIIQTHLKALD